MNLPKQKQWCYCSRLENIFPEMVMESKHYIPNEKGELTNESIDIKAVNYNQLILY